MQLATRELNQGLAHIGTTVLLASPDTLLLMDLEQIFNGLGLRVATVTDGGAALDALETLEDASIVLLDVRLPWVANGRLLASMHESGVHKRCAIALIADQVSDEWIARLREGVVDDIVPRNADALIWDKHLSTMKRGHQLYCELEDLRAAALMEVQHDRSTGLFNRDTMLTLLFRETDRVQRLHGALCLIAFEPDEFDHWRQELGKDACETLLRSVSERTERMMRSYDLLGRVGPRELLLALPGCSTVNAAMLAERMRVEVFGEPFTVLEGSRSHEITLTGSFGIAPSRGRSPVVVMREAEHALEVARRSGPDSIRCAGESVREAEPDAPQLFTNLAVMA